MDHLVYAVFADHDTAQGAIDALLDHGLPRDVIDLAIHEDHVDTADLPAPASESRRYALYGSVLIALLGAVAGALITGGGIGAAFGLVTGGMFGLLVSAISGRTEPKPEIEDLEEQVRRGHVLVTVDASNLHAGLDLERFFEDHGAREVGVT